MSETPLVVRSQINNMMARIGGERVKNYDEERAVLVKYMDEVADTVNTLSTAACRALNVPEIFELWFRTTRWCDEARVMKNKEDYR